MLYSISLGPFHKIIQCKKHCYTSQDNKSNGSLEVQPAGSNKICHIACIVKWRLLGLQEYSGINRVKWFAFYTCTKYPKDNVFEDSRVSFQEVFNSLDGFEYIAMYCPQRKYSYVLYVCIDCNFILLVS